MQQSIAAARIGEPRPNAEGETIFEFRFDAGDPVFAGHFPNRPLLPGIFQLEMTRLAAEWILKCSLAVREISKAKFQRPILPGRPVRLEFKLSKTGAIIHARAGFSIDGQPVGETILSLWRND